MSLIVFGFVLGFEQSNAPLPKVEDIRTAWKQNLERYSNRRIKYVYVRLKGEHRKDFPGVDYPNRFEEEEVDSKDGRWRRHRLAFTPDSMTKERHSAWDGVRATTFHVPMKPDGRQLQADIRGDKAPPPMGEHSLDMRMTPFVIDRLGIRSRISASPLGNGLVVLNPYEDDRASQERYTLDPTKNYWPISYESWNPGEPDKYGQIAHEFAQTSDKWWYPKRVIFTHSALKEETRHYIVVDAQFPNSFDDSAFVVKLPDGVQVHDSVARRTFIVGGEERLWETPRQRGLKEDLEDIPAEEWLFYGGFGAAVTAFAAVAWYFMTRKKQGTMSKARE